jgi:hypothetical protein
MKSLIAATSVVVAMAVAACSGAAVAPASPSPTPASSSAAPSPDDGVIGGGAGGGDTGGGGAGGSDPEPGQPALVLPKPGQLDVHDVAIEQLTAKVADRHVVVNAQWWSGVEPCSVLDSVAAKRDGQTITVSVREGSSDRDAMCIDIAMLKVTAIDLGDLEPGEYTIVASQGPAAAITVKVG